MHRLLLALPALGCLAGLVAAADKKKPRPIVVAPSVFDSDPCDPLLSAISPDGKYVAYRPTSPKNPAQDLCVFDIAAKKVLARINLWPYSVAFTPDSTRLLCAWTAKKGNGGLNAADALEYHVEVSDARTGKILHNIQLKPGQVASGGHDCGAHDFVCNDDILVVAGRNEVATVYDLKTGKTLGDLLGQNRVGSLALSRHGRWLLTADRKKGAVHTWDVKARKRDRTLCDSTDSPACVAISPDGRWCAVGTRRGVRVFDRSTGGEKAHGGADLRLAESLAFTADGKRIVAQVHPIKYPPGVMDWGIRLWDWQADEPPVPVLSPRPPEPVAPKPGGPYAQYLADKKKYEAALEAWRQPGRLHPRLMSSDGKRFFTTSSSHGRFLLDLGDAKAKEAKK